ncbi:MAG: NFACT family protein [Cyanobacteriota bacterium]
MAGAPRSSDTPASGQEIRRPRLQAMDVTTLRALLAAMRARWLPSRFEKAQQWDGTTIQLGLRSLQGMEWLELSWQAEAPRLLSIEAPVRRGDGSTLAQQLQHGLRGLALVSLEQEGWERVVRFGFARRPGAPTERTLVLELMGRHSNLFLLDGDGRIAALGRQVKERQSRWRPIGNGDPYPSPPPLSGLPPSLAEPRDRWQARLSLVPLPLEAALRDCYQGISPALMGQLLAGDPWARTPVDQLQPEQWDRLWQQWQAWLRSVETGAFGWQLEADGERYRCWPAAGELPGDRLADLTGLGAGLSRYYQQHLQARQLAQHRLRLHHRLEAAIAREQRLIRDQEILLARSDQSPLLQQQADALLCLASPSRDQVDEAQKLYRQARRLRRSGLAIIPRLEQHRQTLVWLEALHTFVDQADSLEQLQDLEEEGEELSGDRRPRHRVQRRAPARSEPCPLELQSGSGLRLQVGRNHRQNDWISLRQARRGDLWFHAQECPGSHVVLKSSEGLATEADLQLAADLAAYFSRARGNRRVAVVMVPTSDLQRIAGATAGAVRHRGGQVLWGEPERALPLATATSLRGDSGS